MIKTIQISHHSGIYRNDCHNRVMGNFFLANNDKSFVFIMSIDTPHTSQITKQPLKKSI